MFGILTVAATPIGNAHDASDRLRAILARAQWIAAEDTRRVRRLADALEIPLHARIVSLFDGNEARRTDELVDRLISGHDVLLVSDAGMPTISDPGARLVRRCAERGIRVTAVPGPSAVETAMAVSGLGSGPFCFEGFLPRKAGERNRRLAELAPDRRPTVFFESPRRLAATLADLLAVWGDREAVVCRELTKIHEEVRRGTVAELLEWAQSDVLGEVTMVVAGAEVAPDADPEQLAEAVAALIAEGISRKDAVQRVAAETGAGRRAVYQASLTAPTPARPPTDLR